MPVDMDVVNMPLQHNGAPLQLKDSATALEDIKDNYFRVINELKIARLGNFSTSDFSSRLEALGYQWV